MDTTRLPFVLPVDEQADAADAAATESSSSVDASEERPSTLEEANDAHKYEELKWQHAGLPTIEQWYALRHRFARAERASTALIGVAELLKDHRLAMDCALAQEVPCHSFNPFQEGCLADAESILLWVVHDAIAELKKATCA